MVNIIGLYSSSTSATNSVIYFGTAGSGNGNDNNSVNNNTITAAGSNLPRNAIYSSGTASKENSSVTISNNNIQDYFNASNSSYGIYLGSNNTSWTISGNKFFQSASRTSTTGATHEAIYVSSGDGYTISNNTIGYADASGNGTTSYGPSTQPNRFIGIELAVGTTSSTSVQGNTINGITLSTSSNASTGWGIFSGIYVTAGKVDIGTVSANTIGSTSGTNSISVTTSTTGALISGINVTSTSTCNIQNNNVAAIATGGAAAIGYKFYGIFTAGASGNFTVSGNVIGNNTANSISVGTSGTTSATCSFYGIYITSTGATYVNSNTVQNAAVNTTSCSSVYLYGIYNSGAATGTLEMKDNIVKYNTLAGAYTSWGGREFYGIEAGSSSSGGSSLTLTGNTVNNNSSASRYMYCLSGSWLTSNINSNTVNDNVLSAPASETMCKLFSIYSGNGTMNAVLNMNSNNVYNNVINTIGAQAEFYGAINMVSATNVTCTFSGNNIHDNSVNVTGSASVGMCGYHTSSNVQIKTDNIFNNNIYNYSIGGSGTSTSSFIHGLCIDNSTGNAVNCYNNVINTLSYTSSSTGAAGISGIFLGTGATVTMYKNKIYDINSSGSGSTSFGLNGGAASYNLTFYDNLIGDIKAPSADHTAKDAPSAANTRQVAGLYIAGGSSANIYYNSVYINTTSSGTNFGSSAIYVVYNASYNLTLNNNIFVNTSTPKGLGLTVAYRRSSSTLDAHYVTTSDRNLFYAGTPSGSNLIYYDGTNSDQTLAAFQSRVSTREANSISENPPWFSTTGSDAHYLDMVCTDPPATAIANGAAAIGAVTDDYEGKNRPYGGDPTPDIGAWEFHCPTDLPVELHTFDATLQENETVLLEWYTASETNNQSFSIERSTDIQNWSTVGTVAGAGSSNTLLYYSITDPFPLNGLSYYRLKQTDYDGAFSFSQIKSINMEDDFSFSIYPNPFSDYFTFDFNGNINDETILTLYDHTGRMIAEKHLLPDDNHVVMKFDFEIPEGMYILKLHNCTTSKVARVITKRK